MGYLYLFSSKVKLLFVKNLPVGWSAETKTKMNLNVKSGNDIFKITSVKS